MVTDKEGISFAQFYDLMEICGPDTAVLMEGDTGIGKTSVARRFAEEVAHLPICTIQVSESTDLVDIIGLPDIDSDRTLYKPPSWYLGPDVKCVLFMDEVNRSKVVMKGLMRLATEGRIGDLNLPKGSYILAAINPEYGNMYQVVEMDPAHRARFQVAQLCPTPEEWVAYAKEDGVPSYVIEYVRRHPEDLDTFHNQDNVNAAKGKFYHNVLPCRRQWSELAKTLVNAENFKGSGVSRFDMEHFDDAEEFLYAVVAGRVGVGVAKRFVPLYYELQGDDDHITAEDLLFGDAEKWNKKGDMVTKLRRLADISSPKLGYLGEDMLDLIARNEDKMWNDEHNGPSQKAADFGANFYKFMQICPDDMVKSLYYNKIYPAIRLARRAKETGDTSIKVPKWQSLMCIAVKKVHDKLSSLVDDE